ncbi:hypothetical protein A2U01_0035777, partial [Trifolium medium]|nr:hypothetical protein [Trifolium medium]
MSLFEIVSVTSSEKTYIVLARCKLYCKIKDGENVKQSDVVKIVMNCFEDVLDSPTEEQYVDAVLEFRR